MTPGRQTALILLLLSLVEVTFRAPVLMGTAALYQRDLLLLYFPQIQTVLRELAQGALPLRDPTSAFGQPLLADPGSHILYPPAWIHLFLSPPLAYGWFVSMHSVFGALGVALLVRHLSGGSFSAALFGGCAWLASGPLQSLANVWHHMAGAAWIPWVFLGVERVLAGSPGRVGLMLGAAVGAQILAGSGDMCAMTLLLAALRIVMAGEWRRWRTWVSSGAFAVVLGAGVWLPAVELILESTRSTLPVSTRTYWSLNPLSIFEFFLPLPFAAYRLAPGWGQAMFEGREPFLASMFMGAAALPLGLAALADSSLRRATRLFLSLGAVGAILVAFGKNGPVYFWLMSAIPPLTALRYPVKAMIPATVLICVLAGLGVASARRSARSRSVALLALLALTVLALLFMGPLLAPVGRALLDQTSAEGLAPYLRDVPGDLLVAMGILVLLYGYLRTTGRRLTQIFLALLAIGHLSQSKDLLGNMNALVPYGSLAYKPDHLKSVMPVEGGRVYAYDYSLYAGKAEKYLGVAPGPSEKLGRELGFGTAEVVVTRDRLIPLVGAYWGVNYAWDSDLKMLFDRRLAKLTGGIRELEGTPGLLRLLQISGVERVVAMHEAGFEALNILAVKNDSYPRPLRIFGVPQPLPRASLVSGRVLGTGNDLADLLHPAFDPRASVLVDRGPSRPAAKGFEGRATIVEARSDRIVVETQGNAPAFLGLIEGSMPGWRAWVDGRSAPVERANAVFIGVEVEGGSHRVVFRFLPATAVVGVTLTTLCALFLVYSLAQRSPPAPGISEGMLGRTE